MLYYLTISAVAVIFCVEFYAVMLAEHYTARARKGVYIDKFGVVKAYSNPEDKDGTSEFLWWEVYRNTSLLLHSAYAALGWTDKRFSVGRGSLITSAIGVSIGYVLGYSGWQLAQLFVCSCSVYFVFFCVGRMDYKRQKTYFRDLLDVFNDVYLTEEPCKLPVKR